MNHEIKIIRMLINQQGFNGKYSRDFFVAQLIQSKLQDGDLQGMRPGFKVRFGSSRVVDEFLKKMFFPNKVGPEPSYK